MPLQTRQFRQAVTLWHRWGGLAITVFLVIVGLTGSLLAFYSELDRTFNPTLYPTPRPHLARLAMADLAEYAEKLAPQAKAIAVYLREPERAEVRMGSKNAESPIAFDTLLLDPYTGNELARYTWGDPEQGVINLMPFIYRLHYELALGSTGLWILGIVALAWTLDCFAGLFLTLPSRHCANSALPRRSFWQRWRVAWHIKWSGGAYRMNYDLHRAGGLWLWVMLLIFAWSSVYMNLWDTVYTWTTRSVIEYHPSWEAIPARSVTNPAPPMSWHQADFLVHRLASEQATRHHVIPLSPVMLGYSADTASYRYQFRSDLDIQDRRGVTELSIDASTGKLLAFLLPRGQYAGNTVTNWLYALHMANVFGMPYRVFICIFGLLIAGLALTGLLIWQRKRSGRKASTLSRKNGVNML